MPLSGYFCVLGCRLVCVAIVGCFLPVSGFAASSAVTCHYMHVWRAWGNNARIKSALFLLSPFALSASLLASSPLALCRAVAVALGELVRLGAWLCAFSFYLFFFFYRSIIISDDIIFIII